MCYLAPLFLLALAYVYGTLLKIVTRDDDDRISESCIIGTFLIIVMWEAGVLITSEIGIGFSDYCRIFSIVLAVVFVLALFFGRKRMLAKLDIQKCIDIVPIIIVGLALIVVFACFFMFHPDTKYDYSVETVNTLISTDTIFDYDYSTGQKLASSVDIIERFNAETTFFAYLTSLFSSKSTIVVYRGIPMWIICLSLMIYVLWAEMFFGKSEKKKRQTAMFLAGVATVNICGAFSENSIFYYQMFKGFSAETLEFCIIIPFVIYECFCLFSNKRIRGIIYILIAGLAGVSACGPVIGLIPMAMCICISFLVLLGFRLRRYLRWKQ